MLTVVCKRMQQLPTTLGPAVHRGNKDLWVVMSARGPNNVGRAVQTDPTLLRYASVITEQKKCWELLAETFDRFQTLRNNMQQGVQTDATCNIQQYWELMANNVASVCTGHKSKELSYTRNPASYPEVSLLTLPMVPCGSSPVTRFALASAMRKTKRLRRRLPETHKFLVILSV